MGRPRWRAKPAYVRIPADLVRRVRLKSRKIGISVPRFIQQVLRAWTRDEVDLWELVKPPVVLAPPPRGRGRPHKQRLPYRLEEWTKIIGSSVELAKPEEVPHAKIKFVDNLGNWFDIDGDPINPVTYEASFLPLMLSALPKWVHLRQGS